MCAGILPQASDGEENTGWSHLSHKGNVEVSFLPSVDFFLGGWGEIKRDFNTSAAPFPPRFPANLLLSRYLSEDIFSFVFSVFPPSPPPPSSYQAFEGKHVSMGEENEPFHETFCYGQKGREI